MKKIKFRAWDAEREVMANVSHIGLNDCEVGMEDEECRCWNAPYPYVCKLMQYTGIKDCNDTEIYEGDILKYSHRDVGTIVRYVRIKYGMWGIEGIVKGTQIPFANILESECEVIGNIYENPELLG